MFVCVVENASVNSACGQAPLTWHRRAQCFVKVTLVIACKFASVHSAYGHATSCWYRRAQCFVKFVVVHVCKSTSVPSGWGHEPCTSTQRPQCFGRRFRIMSRRAQCMSSIPEIATIRCCWRASLNVLENPTMPPSTPLTVLTFAPV